MRTNREKYEFYRAQIVAKDAAAIAALIPAGVPAQFYAIEKYAAASIEVTGVSIYRRGIYNPGDDERMTKVQVAHAKKCAEEWCAPTLDDVLVGFRQVREYGTVTGANPYSKIEIDPMLAWTPDALTPEIERRRAMYAPRDGCKACQYCQKQHPENELVSAKIFYRDRGGLQTKIGQYCSNACAGHDQCGHEG
jgi:hypothetical protein